MYVCIGRWFHPVRLRPISGVVGGNIFPPYGAVPEALDRGIATPLKRTGSR